MLQDEQEAWRLLLEEAEREGEFEMRLHPFAGFAFTRRGIRPYFGLRLSLTHPKHTADKQFKILYHCSKCGAINDKDAHFCKKCGSQFS